MNDQFSFAEAVYMQSNQLIAQMGCRDVDEALLILRQRHAVKRVTQSVSS